MRSAPAARLKEELVLYDLAGRRAVITGAGRGFGRALALAFARAGADVVLTARSATELEATRELVATQTPDVKTSVIAADVSVRNDVERLRDRALDAFGGADVLVCNAGVYGPKGPIETTDYDEWMKALAINLGGVVLCTQAFAAPLAASPRGKVIVLSGGGATKPMAYLSAYAASKAAVVRYAETLALEWVARRIDVNAVAPGALNTRLLDEILAAGPEAVGAAFYADAVKQRDSGGAPMARGTDLCTFLASRESDGVTGKLISALWDPWERFAELRDDLAESDVLTLRRIVPAERGMPW